MTTAASGVDAEPDRLPMAATTRVAAIAVCAHGQAATSSRPAAGTPTGYCKLLATHFAVARS